MLKLVLLFSCFILLTTSCSSVSELSFRSIEESDCYTQTITITDKQFSINIDLDNINDSDNTTVIDDSDGKIVLEEAKFITPDTLNLHFDAYGIIRDDFSTILTASVYNDGFLKSPISVAPSRNIFAMYSLQSTDFESFGNHFSVFVLMPERSPDYRSLETLHLTISNLFLISFNKNI